MERRVESRNKYEEDEQYQRAPDLNLNQFIEHHKQPVYTSSSGLKPKGVGLQIAAALKECQRGKPIAHRSQSSPSSLTTHKFGLKATPSPPRLIIDHNTGDIVESYPEQPVYLKTYQPLEDEEEVDNQTSTITDNTLDDSLAHPYPPALSSKRQFEDYTQLLLEHYPGNSLEAHCQASSGEESLSQAMSNRNYRPAIPPPHSGKVYFAPPMVGASAPYYQHQQEQQQQLAPDATGSAERDSMEGRPSQQHVSFERRGSGARSSFKRAIKQLNENSKTDIAIVTDDLNFNEQARELKITATSATKANQLLNQQTNEKRQLKGSKANHPKANKRHQFENGQAASIEDFNLYNFFYILTLLLVCSISTYIIYLLVGLLHLDCNFYRPTFTYLSIIAASVNLICIIIFSLFWYCNSVTRTLYSNLSSSAFIITIYSILVAINLSLTILFFLINTCHFQKLMNTRATFMHVTSALQADQGLTQALRASENLPIMMSNVPTDQLQLLFLSPEDSRSSWEVEGKVRQHSQLDGSLKKVENYERKREVPCRSEEGEDCEENENEPIQPTNLIHQYQPYGEETRLTYQEPLTQSPFEAAWEYVKEEFRIFKRNLRDFVINYDFRFIGALHGLCAICLQYMAMKVAIVRSYFCSPVGSSYV